MGTREAPLRQRFCRGADCGAVFWICRHCDRGHRYCCARCRQKASALSRIASCAMQGGGSLPWEVTCRGVVDGIAMVIHMTRREGRRVVEEAVFVEGYEAKENQWDMQRL